MLSHHIFRVFAGIGAVHDGLVGPFEIERAAERLADPRVIEAYRLIQTIAR